MNQTTQLGNPLVNIAIFALFVVITLTVVIRVTSGSNKKSASSFYTGNAQFSGRQNGFAIAGDYLSAASFLGIAGAVAVYGYDGLLYSIGFLVAWLVALLLPVFVTLSVAMCAAWVRRQVDKVDLVASLKSRE